MRPALLACLLVMTSAVVAPGLASSSTVDFIGEGQGPLPADSTTVLRLTDRAGIADGAEAVILNLTATEAASPGYITVHRCDQERPLAAHLNYRPGATSSNTLIVEPDAAGTVCLYSKGVTQLIADASGYLPAASSYQAVGPARLLDTRAGERTVDGQFAGGGAARPSRITAFRVADRGGVPAGASSVVLNLTATGAGEPGFVTAYDCASQRPLASSLSFGPGETVNNLVIVRPGGALDRNICLHVRTGVHLIADVLGYFVDDSDYVSIRSSRLFDSRPGSSTIDGQSAGAGIVGSGATTSVEMVGRGGIPDDARAVVANLTVTGAASRGFVTGFTCGDALPLAASINHRQDASTANLFVAAPNGSGNVCLRPRSTSHLVVDAAGYFAASGTYVSIAPARVLDTRADRTQWSVTPVEELDEFDGIESLEGSTVECIGVGVCLVGFADVFVGETPQIRRTEDGGATWTSRQVASGEDKVVDIECPTALVCWAAIETWQSELGLERSIDGGRTWDAVPGDLLPYLPADAISCFDALSCVLSTFAGVIRTDDGGATLREVATAVVRDISCGRVGADEVCVAVDALTSGLVRSTDGGATWTPVAGPSGLDLDHVVADRSFGDRALSCWSATGCAAVGISADDVWYLVFTDDSGVSWSAVETPISNITAFTCSARSACIIVGTDDLIPPLDDPPAGGTVAVLVGADDGFRNLGALSVDSSVAAIDCVGGHFCLGVTRERQYVVADRP